MFICILLVFFCYFSTKNLFLNKIDLIYHFYFFFWWSLKFPQENIKQSEIGIGDKKFSAEHILKTGTLLKQILSVKMKHSSV